MSLPYSLMEELRVHIKLHNMNSACQNRAVDVFTNTKISMVLPKNSKSLFNAFTCVKHIQLFSNNFRMMTILRAFYLNLRRNKHLTIGFSPLLNDIIISLLFCLQL